MQRLTESATRIASLRSPAAAFGLMAAICLGLGLGFGYNSYVFLKRALGTQAEVVGFIPSAEAGLHHGTPVLRYRTAEEQELHIAPSRGNSTLPWRVGDRVTVLYDRTAPERVEAADPIVIWGIPVAWGGVAWLCVLLGIGFRASARRRAAA